MDDAMRLFGLKAIVTGAADGIGEAIARTFVKHGAEVLSVDAPATGIESRFSSVRGITGYAADLANPQAPGRIIQAVTARLGGLDIVVNNYLVQSESPIGDSDGDSFRALLERKLTVMSSMCSAALSLLKKSPAGRIINMGFVRSSFTSDGNDAFASSIRAIADLTGKVAADYGQFGITANYIQPGAVMTPGSRVIFKKDKSLRDYCIDRSAAKRLGEPIDVAKVALFLASDDSVFVSGTGIVVDGGQSHASGT